MRQESAIDERMVLTVYSSSALAGAKAMAGILAKTEKAKGAILHPCLTFSKTSRWAGFQTSARK